jgi:hypothetical protein
MKAILGWYDTTPTAAMEIETRLLPTWLRLQTKVLLAATRLQSLSARHPIQPWVEEACRTSTAAIKHRSTLGNIYNQFPFTTARIESIEPYVRAPWWTTRAVIQVAESKEIANTLHDNRATNKYLHCFKKRDSPMCECGYGAEIVEHFLLECPNHMEVRKELRRKVRTRKMKVASLLGDVKTVELTMEYIKLKQQKEWRNRKPRITIF